jgi:predicted phage terminase large subunit-like protein
LKVFVELLEKLESPSEQDLWIIHRCATDLELFSQLFFPHYCKKPFNTYHRSLFKTIKWGERNVRRVRASPRGSAKSTFTTLIKPIHDVCYGLEQFTVIISATGSLANKKLKNIRSEILFNSRLRTVYGVHFPSGKAGESEFLAASKFAQCYFVATGKGSAVRGISIGENRPTKFICDDVEIPEEVLNEAVRSKTADWFFEDVSKAGTAGITNIEFVGTVLHRDSLLKKILANPGYDSLPPFKAIISWSEREDLWEKWRAIYRNIDNADRIRDALEFYEKNKAEMLKGTEVMWPENEDYLAHMIDMEEVGRRAFMKEKQNDPQGSNETIFQKFHWYTETEEGIKIESTGATILWKNLTPIASLDPATGQEKAKQGKLPDFSVMPIGYKDLNGRLFVHYDYTKRVSPSTYIAAIFDMWDRYGFERMAVETNLFRNLLLPNIIDERKRREKKSGKQIEITFYDVENTENKHERIYRLEPKVNHGYILFNRALSREFMQMFEDFPFADHDDAPDAVEILWNLVNNRYKVSPLNLSVSAGR